MSNNASNGHSSNYATVVQQQNSQVNTPAVNNTPQQPSTLPASPPIISLTRLTDAINRRFQIVEADLQEQKEWQVEQKQWNVKIYLPNGGE